MLPEDSKSIPDHAGAPPLGRSTAGPWRRRIVRVILGLFLLLVGVALVGGWWVNGKLRGSLAILDGEVTLAALEQPVTIERDAHGVPTLRGENRVDVARALGYVHAQERFFQMDLIRRQAAGELSELFGGGALDIDKRLRTHRFRWRAANILAALPPWQRQLIEAYAEGVNAGLADLDSPPFEYLATKSEPRAWLPEDSIVVVFAMYLDLQGRLARREASFGTLRAVQPKLYPFLSPKGDHWDAPIVGEAMTPPPIPSAEDVDLRRRVESPAMPEAQAVTAAQAVPAAFDGWEYDPFNSLPDIVPGSNNWAVDGAHSRHGGALLANDMHLGHAVPNIWFRAVLAYPDPQSGAERRMAGVSLPGAPVVVVGSNGHVAWGFTNSYGDWSDLVVLESVEGEDDTYLTPQGPQRLERIEEIIRVKGEGEVKIEIWQSIWGPVVDRDLDGNRLAQRWAAHLPAAVNLGLVEMEGAKDIETAIEIAHRSGVPAQNFVVVDDQGRIGWTIIGPFPRRFGHDGSLPTSWADGTRGWDGLLTSDEVPTVLDPEVGRIWTANARVVGGEMLDLVGDGGYARGARAQQIRDRLLALDKASETDLLAVQLDDRALFLEPWHGVLRQALEASEVPRHQNLLTALDDWSGRAEPDSVAFRMVRVFRDTLRDQVFTSLTAASAAADGGFDFRHLGGDEPPLWQLVQERPLHLLDPRFETWDAQLLAAVDAMLDDLEAKGGELSEHTWGQHNLVWIRHPMSRFMPAAASRWLDMPARKLPGGRDMPRVQSTTFGSSERLVVSPGREEEGIFHMPTGQSGHPLSPYYGDGFEAWANGEATPFLPGDTVYHLQLNP